MTEDLKALTTEADSHYSHLDQMSVSDILEAMNKEDQTVATTLQPLSSKIEDFVKALVENMREGGRLFYIGAGTSGRLGVLDASECPPTFGVSADKVIGLIAGGDGALRVAVEGAEDDETLAWKDISAYNPTPKDTVVGIAASGRTPYVVGGLRDAKANGLLTGCVVCNENSPLSTIADYAIEAVVGPEFLTGSTRLKSGTAQKMILNMISTTAMIQLGHVQGHRMVDMALSNSKLIDRAIGMIKEQHPERDETEIKTLLDEHGSVRAVLEHFKYQTQ